MNVRKIAVYCIALLIILASTGLKLNAHYCHGTFAGFELVYSSCCCDQTKTDKNCCENKLIEVNKLDFGAPLIDFSINKTENQGHLEFGIFSASMIPTSLGILNMYKYSKTPPKRKLYVFLQRLCFYF